ncbi:MAG: DUF427 domain-containing protein [Actinobacteria bacterium]|nr:DUF427 domain-containing protein [Actinomycetota bacterium]
MSLAFRSGPFGDHPRGVSNATLPRHVLYFEDTPKRVRVVFHGETVADSRNVKVLHETGQVAAYYFPQGDVRPGVLRAAGVRGGTNQKGTAAAYDVVVGERVARRAAWSYADPAPAAAFLAGHVTLEWDEMDAWFEEDEQVFLEPRDPYHRVDVLRSSRHVRVEVANELVAESRRPRLLVETGARPRYYLPADDVRTDLLVESDTRTRCQYKGLASYWSVRAGGGLIDDLVWSYRQPLHDGDPIADMLCLPQEHDRVLVEVDGEPVA